MHRVDFHCHTQASPDGWLNETDIKRMLSGGLDTIAITDHDRIDQALVLQQSYGDSIIVGEEITTTDGEIIGLYLQEPVQPGMTGPEAIQQIKQQNGIVYIPHPFEKVRKGLSLVALDAMGLSVDIIEVINGRSFSSKAQQDATDWAMNHKLPMAASSDAHGKHGWGRVYTQLDSKPTRDTLLELLSTAQLHGSSNGLLSYGYPKFNRLRKRFTA